METCACCGFNTIGEKGCYEICDICYWEDDNVQEADPWFPGGANSPSLYQAQLNFQKFGAMEERFTSNVREPNAEDKRNPKWRSLSVEDKSYCTTPSEIEKVWGTSHSTSYNYWERNA
ncbi:cysteine-rich CPCC protein [Arenicella xantha]|uniref:Cysteine-rich CPCC protein n=1 Tax=Arenicella xantha TaxID=644221 RepID=A0A395JH78_9GAMM|nr:cysteine-rich CPCC protein [Arenicella xantha]